MSKTFVLAGTLALSCVGVISAQQTPGSTTTAPPGTTLVGCLYREDQVPGRQPNAAERAGILEDYILADAMVPNATSARPGATPGATGTSGNTTVTSGSMYKIENIDDDRLKALVGKRVEVVGRIDPERGTGGGPTADRGLGPDRVNLPEFEATSIRETAGTCAATPAQR